MRESMDSAPTAVVSTRSSTRALKAPPVTLSPFVFSTGYGEAGLPEHWRGNPTIQKPFTEGAIRDALMKAMNISLA